MSDRLAEIMDWKRQEVAPLIRPVSDRELERLAKRPDAVPFCYHKCSNATGAMSVIAEIKRRSPSAGSIAEGVSAEAQAIKYVNAEADALSVLTDHKFFGGHIRDLWTWWNC